MYKIPLMKSPSSLLAFLSLLFFVARNPKPDNSKSNQQSTWRVKGGNPKGTQYYLAFTYLNTMNIGTIVLAAGHPSNGPFKTTPEINGESLLALCENCFGS